jgi:mono/diheme cytochrome c family protein
MRPSAWRAVALVTGAAGIAALATGTHWAAGPGSGDRIATGRALYAEHCASCHGTNLEGQPNWRERLPTGRMPAPPHDASGHTWHHPDDMLFRITKEGVGAIVPGYESDMPAFADVLSDDEIRAVLAFLKTTWPARERNFQEAVSQAAR